MGFFFPSADSQKVCAPNLSQYQCSKNNQFKEKAQENELDEQQS